MSKHNSTKEALARWEEENHMAAADTRVVKLCGMNPPIEKMDNALGQLVNCEQLSLSTNNIENIAFLANLRNLKILSLGRNHINSFAGLEAVGDVLEQLWISYNLIEKTKGISVLKKLKVLYMSNNLVQSVYELSRLRELPSLTELVMVGNPIEESYVMKEKWLQYVSEMLPRLTKLDGQVIIRREEAPPRHEDSP